jgi:hypothetical protein
MTSREILGVFDEALAEVVRQLASCELDESGRYDPDEQLAAGAATGEFKKRIKPKAAPAAWALFCRGFFESFRGGEN